MLGARPGHGWHAILEQLPGVLGVGLVRPQSQMKRKCTRTLSFCSWCVFAHRGWSGYNAFMQNSGHCDKAGAGGYNETTFVQTMAALETTGLKEAGCVIESYHQL